MLQSNDPNKLGKDKSTSLKPKLTSNAPCRACNGFLSENSGANAIACTECVHLKGCKFESPAEELVDCVSVKGPSINDIRVNNGVLGYELPIL